jgi:antirestriction protein ArdC
MPISKKKTNPSKLFKTPYQKVTEKVLEILKSGHSPFKDEYLSEDKAIRPRNILTDKEYNGANVVSLWMANYGSPYWGTFNQFRELGIKIKKREKSKAGIIFFQKKEGEEGEEYDDEIPGFYVRHHPMFNSEQTESPKYFKKPRLPQGDIHQKLEKYCGKFLVVQPSLEYAYFSPSDDKVYMLPKTSFISIDTYYSVLFHELVHWSGGRARLDRKEPYGDYNKQGDDSMDYAYEELVAEMGSAFIAADLGIPMYKQNAGYLEGYLDVLFNDEKAFFRAGKEAEKAVSYLYDKIKIGKK